MSACMDHLSLCKLQGAAPNGRSSKLTEQAGQTRQAGCCPSLTRPKCWSPLSLVAFPAISPCFRWLLPSDEKLTEIHHRYLVHLQRSFSCLIKHIYPGGSILPILLSHNHFHISCPSCLYPSLGSSIHQPLKAGRPVVSSVQHLGQPVAHTLCSPVCLQKPPGSHPCAEPFHGTSHMPRLAGCAHHVS